MDKKVYFVYHRTEHWGDNDGGDLVLAETVGKAKSLFMRKSDWASDLEASCFTCIRAERVYDVSDDAVVIQED